MNCLRPNPNFVPEWEGHVEGLATAGSEGRSVSKGCMVAMRLSNFSGFPDHACIATFMSETGNSPQQ
jgi:hypothetical protein